jgi:hypothetical protein
MANQTIAALFDYYDDAAQAVRDLEAAGIAARDISLLANDVDGKLKSVATTEAGPGAGTGAAIGATAAGAAGLLAGLGMLAIPGIGPVVAAGWLASTALGAVAGGAVGAAAGGVIGSLIAAGVSREDADFYAEGLRRGGTLVTVKTDNEHAPAAIGILSNRAVDRPTRTRLYQEAGWRSFDPAAEPYTAAQLDEERRRYR